MISFDLIFQSLCFFRGTSLASSEKVTDAEEQKSTSVEGEAPKPSLIVNNQYVLKLVNPDIICFQVPKAENL